MHLIPINDDKCFSNIMTNINELSGSIKRGWILVDMKICYAAVSNELTHDNDVLKSISFNCIRKSGE